MRGEAALQVSGVPVRQLGAQLVGTGRARTRSVRQLGKPRQPELGGKADEGLGQDLAGALALLHQLPPEPGELAIPRVEHPRRDTVARDERVALRERTRVTRAQIRQRRVKRGGELVEMRTPERRSTAHELEALRQEHDCQWPWHIGAEAIDRRPVDTEVLRLAGLEANLEQVCSVLTRDLGLRARELRTQPDELALVRRPAGARGEREVDGLEQVRLAG